MKIETIYRALVMRLCDEWDEDTCFYSSTDQIMNHPHVEALMALGPDVAHLLVERMKNGQISWGYFCMLHRLTGADPVPYEERGKVREMVQRWIAYDAVESDAG